ncbi:MAG: twin transmembrane helix small protein [Gammaproteobacteria bacterium]|nr:twin transmembrane helix small protein [Gammaproteobacteria bacterium]MDD9824545.1 twin transmembrane helix small protein [Gammaproteobacteria bacterium]MDD9864162.1 twin transmembrane helix small protein [Gammaproteobacteria bacterium]
MFFKIVIVLFLLAIFLSLGRALFFLVSDRGQTQKTVRALTWRISLSIGLLALLLLGYWTGLIQPNPPPFVPAQQGLPRGE